MEVADAQRVGVIRALSLRLRAPPQADQSPEELAGRLRALVLELEGTELPGCERCQALEEALALLCAPPAHRVSGRISSVNHKA